MASNTPSKYSEQLAESQTLADIVLAEKLFKSDPRKARVILFAAAFPLMGISQPDAAASSEDITAAEKLISKLEGIVHDNDPSFKGFERGELNNMPEMTWDAITIVGAYHRSALDFVDCIDANISAVDDHDAEEFIRGCIACYLLLFHLQHEMKSRDFDMLNKVLSKRIDKFIKKYTLNRNAISDMIGSEEAHDYLVRSVDLQNKYYPAE